jgi:hypothetical protein
LSCPQISDNCQMVEHSAFAGLTVAKLRKNCGWPSSGAEQSRTRLSKRIMSAVWDQQLTENNRSNSANSAMNCRTSQRIRNTGGAA